MCIRDRFNGQQMTAQQQADYQQYYLLQQQQLQEQQIQMDKQAGQSAQGGYTGYTYGYNSCLLYTSRCV